MHSELPQKERLDMQQKANDLKSEREFKHLMIKYREEEEKCKTAVEIIGTLQKENEDRLTRNETLSAKLGAAETEIKILEQKVKSLEELYRSDTMQYKEQVD